MTNKFVLEYIKHFRIDPYDAEIDNVLFEFDCKCWNVPEKFDAIDWFIYRQTDCIRNSKQQVAQAYFSHKQLQNKNVNEQIEMLNTEKNISWGQIFWIYLNTAAL